MTEPVTGNLPEKYPNLNVNLPLIRISYCVKCKWSLRANWYQQELLQTFTSNAKYPHYHIAEISLVPSLTPGTFSVEIIPDIHTLLGDKEPLLVWERKRDGGFPDSKILKQKIRDVLFPGTDLGHVDKHQHVAQLDQNPQPDSQPDSLLPPSTTECLECNKLNA